MNRDIWLRSRSFCVCSEYGVYHTWRWTYLWTYLIFVNPVQTWRHYEWIFGVLFSIWALVSVTHRWTLSHFSSQTKELKNVQFKLFRLSLSPRIGNTIVDTWSGVVVETVCYTTKRLNNWRRTEFENPAQRALPSESGFRNTWPEREWGKPERVFSNGLMIVVR